MSFLKRLLEPPKESISSIFLRDVVGVRTRAEKVAEKDTSKAKTEPAPQEQELEPEVVSGPKPAEKTDTPESIPEAKKPRTKRPPLSKPRKKAEFFPPHRDAQQRVIVPQDLLARMRLLATGFRGQEKFRKGLLVANESGVAFTVTDLNEAVCVSHLAPKHGNGKILVSFDLIRSMPKDAVFADFAVIDDGLSVMVYRGEDRASTIRTALEDIDDFPVIQRPTGKTVPCPSILGAILECRDYCSPDGGRYAMNGVLLDFDKDAVVATDGKRLHKIPFDFPGEISEKAKRMVVHSHTGHLHRIFDIGSEAMCIGDDPKSIDVVFEGHGFYRMVECEGEFPPYDDVVPSYEDWECAIIWSPSADTKKEVMSGLAAMKVKDLAVKLLFDPQGGVVTFETKDPGSSDRQFHVNTTVRGKDALEISLGSGLLRDILANPRLERVKIRDNRRAVIFEGKDLLHVLMPVQII